MLETTFGEIQLNNNDGQLDQLSTRYAADGRPITLKIGSTEFQASGREVVQPFAQFATVYIATAGRGCSSMTCCGCRSLIWSTVSAARCRRRCTPGLAVVKGTSQIAGLTRPLMFGRVSNVTAQLVDPAILTYQLHSGNIELVSAVYDQGATGLNFFADYPTYAALAAASSAIPAGAYATSLEAGYICLGIEPLGAVTVDARGHKSNVSGNYIETTADIILNILRDFGGLLSSDLDVPGFTATNLLQSGDIGLFLPAGDQSTVLDVVERLAFGAGFFIGDRSGKITLQRLDPPSTTVVHWAFNDRDILNIERLALPYGVPWKSLGRRL